MLVAPESVNSESGTGHIDNGYHTPWQIAKRDHGSLAEGVFAIRHGLLARLEPQGVTHWCKSSTSCQLGRLQALSASGSVSVGRKKYKLHSVIACAEGNTHQSEKLFVHELLVEAAYGADSIVVQENEMKAGHGHRKGNGVGWGLRGR